MVIVIGSEMRASQARAARLNAASAAAFPASVGPGLMTMSNVPRLSGGSGGSRDNALPVRGTKTLSIISPAKVTGLTVAAPVFPDRETVISSIAEAENPVINRAGTITRRARNVELMRGIRCFWGELALAPKASFGL